MKFIVLLICNPYYSYVLITLFCVYSFVCYLVTNYKRFAIFIDLGGKMIEKIEEYAKLNNIPIMQKDAMEFLCNFIKSNNINTILEIGSAIGYSSIKMALVNKDIKITTIEKDIDRYNIAINNVELFNLTNQITLLNEDALTTNLDDKFDLIFIDASKSHNIDFFNKYKNNLNEKGYIITDNLSFHNLVENPSLIKTKNQRNLVNKIKKYIDFLDKNEEFDTKYIPLGDKISISVRKCLDE